MINVRAGRLRRGWTIVVLVEQCRAAGTSVSASEISRIERGIHAPRPALRKTLLDLFGKEAHAV